MRWLISLAGRPAPGADFEVRHSAVHAGHHDTSLNSPGSHWRKVRVPPGYLAEIGAVLRCRLGDGDRSAE